LRDYIRERGILIAPREMRRLQAAFDTAWVYLSANHLTSGADAATKLRRRLAQEIVRLRQKGVRDPKRLAALVIEQITSEYA
jgi:hypothetical protein